MEEALCDVMVFLRRGGREKRDGRKPVRRGTESDRAREGQGDRTQWCLSLFRAEYFSIDLILGARILSFRHNYCQCVELLYGLFGVRVCP